MKFKEILSSNVSKNSRKLKNIEFVVIHYTGMQSTRESIKRLLNIKSKVSCHYFIGRKGEVIRMAKDNRIAWHAGLSKWKNKKNLNSSSIGIEIQNKGHRFGYQAYNKKQINSLIRLCKKLMKKYKIKRHNIIGHSDISPLRKKDPGEKFPWEVLSKKGVSTWYPQKGKGIFKVSIKKKRGIFFKNIHKIGYRYFDLFKSNRKDFLIVKAFQRRFLPKEISGRICDKTLKISHLLMKEF